MSPSKTPLKHVSPLDAILSTLPPTPPRPQSSQLAHLRTRCESLTSSLDSLVETVAGLTDENRSLRFDLSSGDSERAQLLLRASDLSASLHESEGLLAAERQTHSRLVDELKRSHEDDMDKERAHRDGLLRDREDLLDRQHRLETKLIDVESYLSSSSGQHAKRLEAELAETRLRLALAQAERDELEVRCSEAGSNCDAGSCKSGYRGHRDPLGDLSNS